MIRRFLSLAAFALIPAAAVGAACSAGTNHGDTSVTFGGGGATGSNVGGAGGGALTTGSGSGGSMGALMFDGSTEGGMNNCAKATDLVYVVSQENALYSFDPSALQFTEIGMLDCPVPGGFQPFSMAVDWQGFAWVLFTGGDIWKVDITNAHCTATGYHPDQSGFAKFGMGFSTNGMNSTDETLYLANYSGKGLGSLDTTTLIVTPLGQYDTIHALAELTGTGDGRLFGFFETNTIQIAQIDKTDSHIISKHAEPSINIGVAWAFAFWGGSFWLFTNPSGNGSQVDQYDSDGGHDHDRGARRRRLQHRRRRRLDLRADHPAALRSTIYRDEREALQNQVQKLEVDSEEAKRNAAGDEAIRARAEKLEGEITALRQSAERLEAELREIRPARPASRPNATAAMAIAAAAILGMVVVGAVVAVVGLRGLEPPQPPDIAVAPGLTRPPAPAFTPSDIPAPDPEPAAPAKNPGEYRRRTPPSKREGKARWTATVKRAEGLPLAKGSTCFIDATLHTVGTNEEGPSSSSPAAPPRLTDLNDALNGMAMTSSDALERFAKADGKSVFTLKYEDKGTRAATKNQMMLDTIEELGVVFSENLPTFRVELTVPVESAPAPPIAERLARKGVVTEASGDAPAKAGGHCTLRALGNGHHATCIAEIACDGHPLIKSTDAVDCAYDGTLPRSVSRPRDDFSLTVDGDTATITVPGDKGFSIKLALEAAR